MTYKLLYLESYLGLSEETQSPNAGSEDRKGQNPNPASRCTEARASPKGRARGRPRGPALRCLLLAPSPARALGRSGEVAWRGTRTAGPSQGVPGPGSHSPPAPPTTATLAPGSPSAYTPGGRKFFPPFSPGAAQAQGLLQPCESRRGRLLPPPPRPPREPSPAFGFSGPAPKPGPAPRSRQDPGSPAPHPWRPSLALTSGCAAPAPARRPESRGSRVGAGGLMDRGRRRRVAVAGAARVLAGRNGSRSTSSRSCFPPSPPFPSPPPPPPPPGSPGRMPGRGKSVLLPVSLCGYARRGSHRGGGGGGGSGSIAPALSPQPRRPRGWGCSGLGLRAGAALRRGGRRGCGRALRSRGRG